MPSPTLPDQDGKGCAPPFGTALSPSGSSRKGVSPASLQSTGATIADVLNRAAGLITPEGAYHDAWGSVDTDGNTAGWGEKRAVRWSMLEAVYRAAKYASAADAAICFLRQHIGMDWLARRRSQGEAVAKLREAAAKALEQGK